MFRCEGVVYLLEVCMERLNVRPAEAEEVRRWHEEHAEAIPTVNMTLVDARALFAGPTLARAQRVAALPPARFAAIFGQARRSRHYQLGWRLRRIGKAIPGPGASGGCGQCVEIEGACSLACARRLVTEALRDEPFAVLHAAARHAEPAEQIRAAIHARMHQRSKRMGRTRAADR
jgi:hypothetical protein